MSTSTAELWQAVLGELEVTLSEANYKTWFNHTGIISVENNTAVVAVPSPFTREWIKSKYNDQVLAALQKLIDGLDRVEYKVSNMFMIGGTTKTEDTARSKTVAPASPEPATAKPSPSHASTQASPATPSRRNSLTKYKFENFIVGDSNRLAHAAAQLVAEKPGENYNPLFLYGPVGVGKTHLLCAINNSALQTNPDAKTLYTSTETFLNEFTRAIREGAMKQLTDKYRRLDLLLVDDLQFIAGKEKFQEEFFHTFNALHQSGRQIVLCSDRPPKAIPTLEDRLRSRFEWGMVADITAPDLETRIAILQNKAIEQEFNLPDNIALLIAEQADSNTRELEGALTHIIARCRFQNLEISEEVVQQVLGHTKKSRQRKVNPRLVVERTAQYYNLKAADLTGVRRNREIVLPRQISMYIMHHELGMSLPQVAHVLGGRDHTTVLHGYRKIERLLGEDEALAHEIRTLSTQLIEAD